MRPLASLLSLVLTPALVATASAQSFNIDVGSNFTYPEPDSLYGGAAAQPGHWNPVLAFFSTNPLNDLSGFPSGVTLTTNGGIDFQFPNPLTTGDDENLMDDTQDPNSLTTWTFSGLADGDYTIYTYAMAPDSAAFLTDVSVAGAGEGTQTVGGAWAGHTQGTTYALHTVTVVGGADVVIDISPASGSQYGALNGFQVIANSGQGGTSFCNGTDNALASCPCSNPGGPNSGCEVAQGTGGVLAVTTAQDTNALTAQITATGFPPMATPTAIVIRGETQEPVPVAFGDGLRCVGTQGFVRLAATTAVSGTALHDFGHGAGAGVYYYQVWFRNTPVSYCVTTGASSGAFNLSNGQRMTW